MTHKYKQFAFDFCINSPKNNSNPSSESICIKHYIEFGGCSGQFIFDETGFADYYWSKKNLKKDRLFCLVYNITNYDGWFNYVDYCDDYLDFQDQQKMMQRDFDLFGF